MPGIIPGATSISKSMSVQCSCGSQLVVKCADKRLILVCAVICYCDAVESNVNWSKSDVCTESSLTNQDNLVLKSPEGTVFSVSNVNLFYPGTVYTILNSTAKMAA